MDNKIYLLTQGDDLGGSHSANLAIMEAYRDGILRNASFMAVCGETSSEAAKLVAEAKELCVGLHCTLHSEWDAVRWGPILPANKVPSLVREDGTFHESPLVMKQAGFDKQELFAELDAQLHHMRKLGLKPVYADSHMRFEWVDEELPAMFDDWCASEGLLSFRPYLRRLPIPSDPPAAEKDAALRLIGRLSAAEPGLYGHVTHPTYDDPEIRSFGNAEFSGVEIAKERDEDRRMWLDKRLMDYCRENGVKPITYIEAAKLTGQGIV